MTGLPDTDSVMKLMGSLFFPGAEESKVGFLATGSRLSFSLSLSSVVFFFAACVSSSFCSCALPVVLALPPCNGCVLEGVRCENRGAYRPSVKDRLTSEVS